MSKRLKQNEGKQGLLSRIFANNKYCWAAFGCSAAIMVVVYFCFSVIPFGDGTVLRMDLYHQYGPLFAEFYDRVTNFDSLIYSWNTGLGGSFLGNFYNYICSPISLIMLLFGHENMPEAIATIVLLQAAFASASFTYYLKGSLKEHSPSTAAFGVLYSFCGFFIAYYWNIMWLDAMVYFPLLILGIEKIINNQKPALYIFSLAATLITGYYMGYMACIFSVLYFLVYYFSHHNISDYIFEPASYTDKNGKEKIKFIDKLKSSTFLTSGFTFAFSSILGAALVAFALLPVFFALQNSSATSGSMPDTVKSYFSIFDFLANHLASLEPTIRSSGSTVLPNVYCGIGTVILVPLYLFAKKIPVREKIAHVSLLGLLYFSFNINILNYIWHAFHFPNDLPYRFSFMYSFILLVMAYKAFKRLHEFTGKEILGAGTAILFGIVLIEKISSKNVNDTTIIVSIIFVVLYTVIFYLFSTKKYQPSAMAVLMLCCVCAEMVSANTDHYSMGRTKEEYTSDYSDFRELKSELDKRENDEFYRMELASLRARMDPAWYNYNGVSTFSSMAYEKLANLQQQLGLSGNYINSYTYAPQTAVYNAMMSLKYVVNNNKESLPELNPDLYDFVSSKSKFFAYENKYNLPIAYCVNNEIKEWNHSSQNPFEVQNDYFEKATGIEDVLKPLTISDQSYSNVDPITDGLDTGYMTFYKIDEADRGAISFIIVPEVDQNVYIFVESNSIDSVNISNGHAQYSQRTDREFIYDLGKCKAGVPIIVEMTVAADKPSASLNFFAYGLDMEKFQNGYNYLNSNSLKIDTFEDTKIKGTINADRDCVVYTSIPYDNGFKIIVDGKELAQKDIIAIGDALLGFNISQGEHTVEFKYTAKGLLVGSIISIIALLIVVVLFIIRRQKNKKLALANSLIDYDNDDDFICVESDIIDINDNIDLTSDEDQDTDK